MGRAVAGGRDGSSLLVLAEAGEDSFTFAVLDRAILEVRFTRNDN
jgi:hypothetical protein